MHQLRKRWDRPAGFDEVRRGGRDRARSRRRVACGARGGRRADRALARRTRSLQLKSGNERFVSHPELCSVDLAQSRSAVAGGIRRPGRRSSVCADSRVPPELIFGGHGVGELFVARDAGNLVDIATFGTVEYRRRRSRLAADRRPRPYRLRRCEGRLRRGDQERNLSWRDRPDDRADRAGGACGAQRPRRFHQQRRQGKREADRGDGCRRRARSSPIWSSAGKVKIVAAIYDLQTGVVTYLD